jgi:teichuronic acid biosynthesis glycosyltransferase TuaC
MWPTNHRPHRAPFLPEFVESLRSAGVHCDVLVPPGSGRLLPYVRALWRLHSRPGLNNYDLVHAHYGFAGVVGRLQRTCPLVVTFHGSDLNPKTSKDGRATMFGRFESALSRLLARHANANIAVSPSLVERLSGVECAVIPIGVDLERFHPMPRSDARRALALSPNRTLVLFAADPALTVKRFDLAKAAVDHAKKTAPDIELLPVHGRPHNEMALWLNAADVLLITSVAEGSPVVVKEANACNLPVVTVAVGDIADQLRHVQPSAVVPPQAHELAGALSRILHTEKRSNGRASLTELDSHTVAARHIAFYESVLN